MKQKPFIKIKTPAYYIGLGLMKADSSIRPLFIYGRSAKNEEVLEKFDVYAQFEHYFNLAKKGMITDDIESALVSKCLRTPLLVYTSCLLYTSPSPRDRQKSRMPSSA